MKKNYQAICTIIFGILTYSFMNSLQAQAFHKGTFLIGLSEGKTWSGYRTEGPEHQGLDQHLCGERDPITLEYGFSNRWGFGINMGADIFTINPAAFYASDILKTEAQAVTSEFTVDAHYHFFVTDNTDLSVVGSLGGSSITIKGKNNDLAYQYIAGGGIVRLGLHAKYYFWKRLGVQVMASIYSSNNSPQNVKGNTFGNLTNTSVKGKAIEFGPCFRLGRLNSR